MLQDVIMIHYVIKISMIELQVRFLESQIITINEINECNYRMKDFKMSSFRSL